MRYLIFLLALLFTFTAQAQKPDVIPDSYEKKYKRLERKVSRTIRKKAPDVILDPIESLPIAPTFYALETGNWGPGYLGVDTRADDINARKRRKVAVFIFDTGGCYDHPYLNGVVWNELGKSFTGEDCEDGHGHSTHVAGIIAAHNPAYPLGAARMLRDGFIKLIPIKVLSNGGSGSFGGIVNGTNYANGEAEKLINEGWFVIYNYSLGGGSQLYKPLEQAFDEAEKLGVLINCAANGNTGGTPLQYPGISPYTLGTAALQQSGNGVTRASYSSYGPETWGAAPGSSILSTFPPDQVRILSGTSMATPHQCAIFAILASVWPDATADELKAHYIEYATDLGSPGRDDYYGFGAGLIGPLLDNVPGGDRPGPPTCEDGKQNGNETGIDCGGDCPPCEEPEPDKPPYTPTSRQIVIEGKFPMGWFPVGGSAKPEVWDMSTVALAAPAARKDIIVTRIGFVAHSVTTFEWEYDALVANAKKYFKNRAIGTPESWDGYDRGKYIPFFLDWMITNERDGYEKQDLKPTVLEFEMDGRLYEIAAEDLPDYK